MRPVLSAALTRLRCVRACACVVQVLDAAYKPRDTPLLSAAREAGCVAIEGIEMLFEQGCAQCELWTGRPAPRPEIVRGPRPDTQALPSQCFQCSVHP